MNAIQIHAPHRSTSRPVGERSEVQSIDGDLTYTGQCGLEPEFVNGANGNHALNDDQVQRITKAIADPQRFAILESIAKHAELPCKTLVATLSIKQATISHHLKELVAAELIESRKQGQRAILSCRRDICDAYLSALRSRFEPGTTH